MKNKVFPAILTSKFSEFTLEAGVDEAGRGCLAGPVAVAAVILPETYELEGLTDSKLVKLQDRIRLRAAIISQAISWQVVFIPHTRIDEINILQASFEGMHKAIDGLDPQPEFLAIDGNKFPPYKDIPFECLVKGDRRFANIAAASILAKTSRDAFMEEQHLQYPHFGWDSNKGYPTKKHREAIQIHGPSPIHRKSFKW
ncbi:MAG: ribonuclease HII [Bacteroidota bacterium]